MSELAKPEPMPPAPYRALWAATDGLIREIVEMHGPVPSYVRPDGSVVWWECRGCEAQGYEWEYPEWPCRTAGTVAQHFGVELDDRSYVVDVEEPSGLSHSSADASPERPTDA